MPVTCKKRLMERKRKASARVISLVLAVMMLMSVFSVCFVADASLVTKKQRSYDIAVAFDNSGSMYENNQAWCQAKYAMEIFASMLNYENGDTLTIFPMWKVVTDGSQPAFDANANKDVKPVVVDSKEDIELISNMFTIAAGGTPFAPVREAYSYLKSSSKSDKWLVVLTDGAFGKDTRNDNISVNVQAELNNYASADIKVQYLGIGNDLDSLNANPDKNLYVKTSSAENLQSDLSEICNRIFKRSVLASKYISGNKITLDVSMNNLIVFAQGADESVKINSIKNASGESVASNVESTKVRKFSEISANYLKEEADWTGPAVVDTTLFGHVVTFAACPKGEYTIDCSGAKNIQIFYEPNVDILVTLKEKETGEEVYNSATSNGEVEVAAGKFRLDYKIIDRLTGEDVSESDLLGNVDLKAAIITSDGKETKVKKGGDVDLKADESTFIKVSGTYLDDYTITTEDNKAGFCIRVKIPEVDDLQIDVEGADNWYTISQNEKWQPMKAKFTLNGQPLTAEQMKSLEFAVKSSKESLQLKTEMLDGESAAIVYIAKDEAGNFVKPETGIYTLEFAGQLPANEYGLRPADSEKKLFEIQNYAEYWRWLIYVVAFAILLAIFLAFMSQKVLPKRMDRDKAKFWTISAGELDGNNSVKFDYSKKGKSITVSGPTSVDYDEQCSATFTVKAVDNRFTPSKKRRTAVVGISSSCEKVKLGVVEYVCINGQWVKAAAAKAVMAGKDAPVLEQVLSVSPSFELIRAPGGAKSASLKCSAKTKK